jgi:hypothetical protein
MTTGVAPEVVQNLAIAKTRPEWAELYLQPTEDSEMAAQLAALALHPFRASLALDWSPEPEEQVRRSDHIHALWEKQQAAQEAELYGTPETPPAAPQSAPPQQAPYMLEEGEA